MGNKHEVKEENNKDGDHNADINSTIKIIYEISLSGIFALNKGLDVTDMEKLWYIYNALGQNTFHNQIGGSIWTGLVKV